MNYSTDSNLTGLI